MDELLVIAGCIALAAVVFYYHHAVRAAYYQGRYDELIESEPWNEVQRKSCYMAGINDTIATMQKTAFESHRQAYVFGRNRVVEEMFCQHN